MACLHSDGVLYLYNILENFAQFYKTPTGIAIVKVWFSSDKLFYCTDMANNLSYYSASLRCDIENLEFCCEFFIDYQAEVIDIDVNPTYIIIKTANSYIVHNILTKDSKKYFLSNNSRYCKGNLID